MAVTGAAVVKFVPLMASGMFLDVFHWFLFLLMQFQSLSLSFIVGFGILAIVIGCPGCHRRRIRIGNGFW